MPTLTREEIVDALAGLVRPDQVVTDAEELRRSSVDRFRKYEDICGVWTQPPPAAVVMAESTADVAAVLMTAEPASGTAPDALRRILAAAWRELDRFHALVAINAHLPRDEFHRLHVPVLTHLAPLVERGQQDGAFRADVPIAWHLSMLLAIVHAASGEVRAGRMPAADVEDAMIATVLGAIGAEPRAPRLRPGAGPS